MLTKDNDGNIIETKKKNFSYLNIQYYNQLKWFGKSYFTEEDKRNVIPNSKTKYVLKGNSGVKMNFFSEKRAVRESSILTTCLVFLSFVPYIFWLKRSRKSSLDFRHLRRFLSRVLLTSSCL